MTKHDVDEKILLALFQTAENLMREINQDATPHEAQLFVSSARQILGRFESQIKVFCAGFTSAVNPTMIFDDLGKFILRLRGYISIIHGDFIFPEEFRKPILNYPSIQNLVDLKSIRAPTRAFFTFGN